MKETVLRFNSKSVTVALLACSYIVSEFHDGYFTLKASSKRLDSGENKNILQSIRQNNQKTLAANLQKLARYFRQIREPTRNLAKTLTDVSPEFASVLLAFISDVGFIIQQNRGQFESVNITM